MAENEVYEVEEIIDQREVDDQLQFFVKWKNYNNDWNTWEPIDNLLDCFDLVLEFQEKTQSTPKRNAEKSKLARKEALKIVKKAKKLNSGSDNIKKALQRHAAIVNNQDVSLNLSVDTSVCLDSSQSESPSPKSTKSVRNTSPKSPKKTASLSPPAKKSIDSPIPAKRTPKKPIKLEEFYDPSKMFIKSSSTLNLIGGQNSKNSESPSVLRTLLTMPKSNKMVPKSQTNSINGNQKTLDVASNKTFDQPCIITSLQNIRHDKKSPGKSASQIKKKVQKPDKEKKMKVKTIVKGSKGIKTLKKSDKSLKTKKKAGLMLVKMKPVIKKEKLDDSVFSSMSDQSLSDGFSEKTGATVVKTEGNLEKAKASPSLGVKKIVKKKQTSDSKAKQEKEPKKKVKKVSEKDVSGNSEKKAKVRKPKCDGEKKIVKKKNTLRKDDKTLKRKCETIEIIDTESDDGEEIRISESPKAKKGKMSISPKNGENVKKIEVLSKIEKELSKKTLQVKVKPMENTSHMKKIQLIDTMKTKTVMPKSVVRPISPTPVFTSVKPIISNARPIIPMETMCADVAATGYHYVPAMIPISPSSMSYKMLLDNLPFQYQPKKSSKKRDEDSMDEVERRMSVRQSECAYRYKEIVVKKCNKYTQIWLNTHTKLKNCLNPQVIQEIVAALNAAKYDDSNLVMFSGLGNVFCSGIDLAYLITMDRKIAARKMVDALRDFMKALITFPKPLVAVVAGSAIGLGMTMLPLCDIVYASDKASFHLPYAQLCQTPEGCASYMLPNTVGMAMANELLIGGRKITAIEACQLGLVSQVFWPTSIMQEVIPRIENMALQSGKALETTKLLLRSHNRTKIELTNESECNLLLERWPSSECQKAIENYLNNDNNFCL